MQDDLQAENTLEDINGKKLKVYRFSRIVILLAIIFMVIYLIYAAWKIYQDFQGVPLTPEAILPYHFTVMFFNAASMVLTIYDLYQRDFPNPNSKLTWCLLILCTGGIGWVVYVLKYFYRYRPPVEVFTQ